MFIEPGANNCVSMIAQLLSNSVVNSVVNSVNKALSTFCCDCSN